MSDGEATAMSQKPASNDAAKRDTQTTGDAAMALIKSDAVRLPAWSECHTKKSFGFELTALEYFIEQNEPVGYAGDCWRIDLAKALAECRK